MKCGKLSFQILGVVVIAVCGQMAKATETQPPFQNTNTQIKDSLPKEWAILPQIDGEIAACLPSPDYSKIAILYVKQTRLCPLRSIVIFDVKNKKLVGNYGPLVNGPVFSEWTWSPDSNWLTIPEEKKQLRLIGSNGQSRIVQTHKYVGDVIWRAKQPNKFLYISNGSLCEYDLNKQNERIVKIHFVKRNSYLLNVLFNVNGKPCVVSSSVDNSKSAIAFMVDSGKPIFKIDTQGIQEIELSPDGKFVKLIYDNKKEYGIVARVKDIKEVMSDRSRALIVEELFCPYFPVTWPIDSTSTCAIVNGYPVDLSDGCLLNISKRTKRISTWKPAIRDGKKTPQWLVVGKYGLYIDPENRAIDDSPLIGHTLNNDD